MGAEVAAAASIGSMFMANKSAGRMRGMAAKVQAEQLAFQKEQAALLEDQKAAYREMTFKNPYANVQNPYAGLQRDFKNLAADTKNVFAGMENRKEDLTDNIQAADFQAEQGQQQRANILSNLRGVAGSSGIAGLAQTLSNQGQLQAREISIGIGQQEQQNRILAAQEGARIDQLQRTGEQTRQQQILAGEAQARQLGLAREQLIASGASQADLLRMQGEASLQEAEMSRQATLLGMQYGASAGANQGLLQAQQNMMSAQLAGDQMMMDSWSTFADVMKDY